MGQMLMVTRTRGFELAARNALRSGSSTNPPCRVQLPSDHPLSLTAHLSRFILLLTMDFTPRTPIRATWSSLQCLSNLSPPSPTISPRSFPTTITSGEIPIFLDSGIRTNVGSPSSPGSPSARQRRRRTETENSLDLLLSMLAADAEADIENFTISALDETTNASVVNRRLSSKPGGTRYRGAQASPFNIKNDKLPVPCKGTTEASTSHLKSTRSSTTTFGERTSPVTLDFEILPCSPRTTSDHSDDESNPLLGDEDTISVSYALQGSESYHSASTYYTAQASLEASNTEQSFLSLDIGPEECSSVLNTLYTRFSTEKRPSAVAPLESSPSLSTRSSTSIVFAQPMSPISISSDLFPPPRPSRSGRLLARRSGVREATQSSELSAHHHRQSQLTQPLLINEVQSNTNTAHPITIPHTYQPRRLRSGSTSTIKSTQSFQSVRSSMSASSSACSWFANSDSLAAMPPRFQWLKDITVELMIDQEGFRAVAPAFKLVGFTDVGGGIAHFLPVKRRTLYTFHHAIFDVDPVLYRIQVNGQEKRDHLTRQATLALKIPGVYTVSGTEVLRGGSRLSATPPEPMPENFLSLADVTPTPLNAGKVDTKLEWIFTYCVEPRINARGVVVEGERALRPMSFACSPMLLHPNQARKVGILRLAAKMVQPKLAAQRVAPPAPPMTPQHRMPFGAVENVVLDIAPPIFGWNDQHARGGSHTSEDSRAEDEARPLIKRVSKQQILPQALVDAMVTRVPLDLQIIPDSQRMPAPAISSQSIAARYATSKVDTPVFNDFSEELNVFGYSRHRRTGSKQSNTSSKHC